MPKAILVALDLFALSILVFGLYYRRHRRSDIVVALLGLNVGIMAVATALSSADVSAGLGLGLFGVLSIIRVRSSELSQEEVAYYFSALAIGLLSGFEVHPAWVTPVLMTIILLALFVGDHPRMLTDSRYRNITLDQAYTDEVMLLARLETLLGGTVQRLSVKKIDMVNDSTEVDVRYRVANRNPKPGSRVHR